MSGVPTPTSGVHADAVSVDELADRLRERFDDIGTQIERGELVVHVTADRLLDVLTFCKSVDGLACELLADVSGVHWPDGARVVERQPSTTGWPDYRISRDEGVVEVLYVLRSVSRNHWLRIVTSTPDDDPRLPSATGVYETANFHEREVYDFFGVDFEGHPNLTRILMPDDWVGHPHRKDYPLGGVDIDYHHDKFIPPPDERAIREVVE